MLTAFSGRTITLKCTISPAAFQRIMSTPLMSDAVDGRGKLQHRPQTTVVRRQPFAGVSEPRPAEHRVGGGQIFENDLAAPLRRMDDGGFEHRVGVEHGVERGTVVGAGVGVPAGEVGVGHGGLLNRDETRRLCPAS